jgi:predicted nuclease of predicted toxin-antitoxin system
MRFLADENFPLPSVELLSGSGHDVAAVAREAPGASDEEVLGRAAQEGRILLTFDRDFGSLIYQRGAPVPEGLVYFRFVPSSLEEPALFILALIDRPEPSILGTFTVAERDRVRQRPLPRAH